MNIRRSNQGVARIGIEVSNRLSSTKALWQSLSQTKGLFNSKLVEGSSYLRKLKNKTSVICTKTHKLTNFFHILGLGPVPDTLSFGGIRGNSMLGNHMP